MTRWPLAAMVASLALGGLLSGCVAAVIPLAAAGTIGKGKVDRPKRGTAARAAPPAAVPAMPTDTRMTLLPAGATLPPPDGSVPSAAPAPEAGWRALIRHVARAMSGGASCGDGRTAVLIDADVAGATAAARDASVASINALRTMGATVLFVAADAKPARAALTAAGMAETDSKVATKADVKAIARDGCVIASGGGARDAYTGLTWFALPGGGTTMAAAVTR